MDKLNYLNTGTLISDEAITVTGSAQYLAHDCWNNLELWTGEGGTGTQLTVDTDYTLGGYDAYNHGYNTVAVTNAAYDGETLYATYESLGDYVDADDVNSKADKVTTPTAGNLAGLDASGNLTDSGSKATDFATSGHSHSNASAEAAGFMSADDKTKLTGIAENANNYTHPNHSGDVTSVGDGATTIADDAVTNAKMANMVANSLKGNATADSADPSDISIAANKFPARASTGNLEAKSITDFGLGLVAAADAAAGRTALGAAPTASPVFTGSITTEIIKPASDSTTAIQLTKADGTTPVMTLDTSNSRIGIGTSSPTGVLHLVTTSETKLEISSSSTTNRAMLQVKNDVGIVWEFNVWGSKKTGTLAGVNRANLAELITSIGCLIGTVNKYNVSFMTDSTERVRVHSGGGLSVIAGYLELSEISEPSAGAADTARIYAVANGSLTDIRVRTNGEAGQRIALCGRENTFTKTQGFDIVNIGNSGTSKTIDWTAGNKQKMTLTGNCEVSFTDPASTASLILVLTQDATGSRTVTWSGMTVKWAGGVAPTLSTAASSIDIVTFLYDVGADVYYGSYSSAFAAVS